MKKVYPLLFVILIFSSCVSTKKYNTALMERDNWKMQYNNCDIERKNLQNKVTQLKEDTAGLWNDLKTVMDDYADLQAESEMEEKRLNNELQERKEELEAYQIFLTEKEERVKELQNLLRRKDSLTQAILQKVQDALVNFDEEDLTVQLKKGKVYVSLSEQLLFQSGSYVVNQEGKEALSKLAEVLNKNQDIQVMIEGHTDTVPIKSGNIRGNWDLSVLRATSVVRILTVEYKVSGKRLVACGKGEYNPIATNKTNAGRQVNRRTEIILTPKLEELFEMLNETALE